MNPFKAIKNLIDERRGVARTATVYYDLEVKWWESTARIRKRVFVLLQEKQKQEEESWRKHVGSPSEDLGITMISANEE